MCQSQTCLFHRLRGKGQILCEDERIARTVDSADRDNVMTRQINTWIETENCLVVPRANLAGVDATGPSSLRVVGFSPRRL
jgi:hypothetical protein